MNSPNKKLKQLSSKQLATLGHKIRTEQHLAFPHEPVAIIGIYDQFSIQDIITKTDLHLNHQTGLFVCSCEKQTIHLKQFQGTCICVQGSILLAAHLACQSLRTAETNICVAADSSNNSIILERYDDALGDHSQIWSIIRGSTISNGGCLFKNDLIDPDQLISNEPYNDIIYSLCPTMSSIRPYFYGIYSKELYGQYLQLILEHPGVKKSRNQKFSSCFLSHIMPFVDTPKVDQSLSMIELGLDSLMMTTLKNQLEKKCAMIIPTHLFNGEIPLYQVISDLEMHIQQKPAILKSTLENPKQKDFLANMLQMASTEIPQESLRIEKQVAREVIVNGQKKIDFASCNYLGLDLHPEILNTIPKAIKQWGVHPSWTRSVAYPKIFEDIENKIADWINAPHVLLFPSITLIHTGVLPVLAKNNGIIFQDIYAHYTTTLGARMAETQGAKLVQYGHNDLSDLEQKLNACPKNQTKIVIIDGVFSMSGTYPDLKQYVHLAKQYNAMIYIDDAHGIGILGEKPDNTMPYGYSGNGIVRHFGLNYEHIIYIAGLSKAFSSYGAFITCNSKRIKQQLQQNADTYGYSGPSPTASLASALKGIEITQWEGNALRQHIYNLTKELVDGARNIGFEVINALYLPIVSIFIGDIKKMIQACQILWADDLLITPAYYPVVPYNRSTIRFSITSLNTREQVIHALKSLTHAWSALYES